MGNGQSVEAPRRPPNRLSKPRTNSSTNLLNLKSTGPPSRRNSELNNAARRYSTVSVNVVAAEETQRREATQKKRLSMFRSKSAQPKSEPLQIDTGVNVEFLERSPLDNWSTRASITHESPDQPYYALPGESRPLVRPARMSLQHVPYAHHPRLSLVAEAPSQPDEWDGTKRTSYLQTGQEEKRRSQYIQDEEEEEEASPQVASGLPQRTNSETELFAPIRRRSLLQHGIATRKSWVENDARQSLPSQMPSQAAEDDFQKYYYNPAKPTSSPLSNLEALASNFEDVSPGPRTMTPNDLDYGHIGAFKLGSLRITNGTVSPSPSLDRPATSSGDEDSFEDDQGSAHSHHVPAPSSYAVSPPREVIRAPWITRAASPLRQLYEPEEEPLRVDTHLPLPEFSAFTFTTESPTKSQDLAHEYMEDLPLSPFSFDDSPPRTPRLEATSKHTAVEDDLFAAELESPEIEDMHPSRSFDSGYHAEEIQVKKIVQGARDLAPKPLAKADSGYSSNVSLRSFKGTSKPVGPAKDAPPTPPKDPVSRVTSSVYSVTSSYSEISEMTIKSKSSLPALPKQEIPAPLREAPPVPLKPSSVQTSGKVVPAPTLPNKSPERAWATTTPHLTATPQHARQKSIPAVPQSLRDEFPPSHSPSGSTGSESSGSTSRLRKDKKRPQSLQPQPIFTVQAFRSVSEFTIPPVPAHVSRHLEERVDSFPVACFPNTIASPTQLRRTASKETLQTIFSVGSAEYREEPSSARLQSALPPVPVHSPILEVPTPIPEVSRRHTFQPASPVPAPISQGRNRQSFQAIPRKATPVLYHSQQMFETHITSYEAVSSSLGKSPYDFDLGPMKTHPTAQERAKSMTSQLEAEARERFARARSVSQESFNTYNQTVSKRKSWDSPANPNVASSITTSPLRGKPPLAHAKWSGLGAANASPSPTNAKASPLTQQRSEPNSTPCDDSEGQRFSMLSRERVKSPPPVSMQTQRKMLPVTNHIGSHLVIPPSRTPPVPPQDVPSRAPPPPPFHSPQPQPPSQASNAPDPWANQKTFWAERRKSAGEALQGRKSAEMRRPESTRQSVEQDRQRPGALKSYCSWDASQQRWDGHGGRTEQYDHTYGSYSYAQAANKENWAQGRDLNSLQQHPYHLPSQHQAQDQPPQEEYYDPPFHDEESMQALPQTIHRLQTSTSEMLVLDRFSGGLDYGYEPGIGLGGSAGTRNVGKMAGGGRKSFDVSTRYGVDFSDVPIFLQRVKVE